jgi:hypothetical protein
MKKMILNKDSAVWVFLVVAGLFGVYVGFVTIKKFEMVISGLTGLANLYLIHLLFFPPKNFFKSMPYKILSLVTAKYIVMCFFICLIMSWSLIYFIDSLLYLLSPAR